MNSTFKLLSISLILIGLSGLNSCKKDFVCQCVQTVTVPAYTYNNQTYPQQVTINTITNTFKSKKKDAVSGCKQSESIRSYPSPYAAQGQGPTIEALTCDLK